MNPDEEAVQKLDAAASTLLPGNDTWPSGGTLGLGHRVLARAVNAPRFQAVLDTFLSLSEPGFAVDAGAQERHSAMTELQVRDPDLFGLLVMTLYDAYYTHPQVIALISERAGIRPGPPQPLGHVLRLDPARDVSHVRAAGVRWRDDMEPIGRTVRAAQQADPYRVWDEEEIAAWSR